MSSFWEYYVSQAQYQWNHMNPIKYGFLLVFVFIGGYLLLKSGIKRT